jgi:hypothetical protein
VQEVQVEADAAEEAPSAVPRQQLCRSADSGVGLRVAVGLRGSVGLREAVGWLTVVWVCGGRGAVG